MAELRLIQSGTPRLMKPCAIWPRNTRMPDIFNLRFFEGKQKCGSPVFITL